jgi:hypothetical protein
VVHPPDDVTRTLTPLGAAGWETTGVVWPDGAGNTLLVLKRAH